MDLHWPPVQQRVLFKVLISTYQAYHKTAPSYLCDLITPYSNSCNLRSNNQLLQAPCQPKSKLKTYGERSFRYAAPNEWNNLPLIICESPSPAIFKNKLKTFLFQSTYSSKKYICFLLMSSSDLSFFVCLPVVYLHVYYCNKFEVWCSYLPPT